jgi:2-methylcitrate dehydratase PrpD
MNSISQKAPVLSKIADFISDPDNFDDETIHQARRVIADTMGVAFSGVRTSAFEIAIESLPHLFGEGKSRIWATDKDSTLLGAVFYNALSVSATDFDEGHRKAVGHPASLVVPVAVVLGEHLNKSFSEVIKAVITGYEAGTRFSDARVKEKITTYSSGRWGAIASAATAAYLLDLNTEKTMHALSLASVLSPAMLGGSTDVSTGSMAKEGVAWAAQNGLQSALLAQKGFVGPYLFVDEHDDFERQTLLEGLGKSWLINSNYFKPYSCCRWLHTAISAAIGLKAVHRIDVADIERIEVSVFERALQLISSRYPQNPVQAQFHLPYVV